MHEQPLIYNSVMENFHFRQWHTRCAVCHIRGHIMSLNKKRLTRRKNKAAPVDSRIDVQG